MSKPKARANPKPIPVELMAIDLDTAVRTIDHIQSGLRNLTFAAATLLKDEKRTPEIDARLAELHQDEAKYHQREAERCKKSPRSSARSF